MIGASGAGATSATGETSAAGAASGTGEDAGRAVRCGGMCEALPGVVGARAAAWGIARGMAEVPRFRRGGIGRESNSSTRFCRAASAFAAGSLAEDSASGISGEFSSFTFDSEDGSMDGISKLVMLGCESFAASVGGPAHLLVRPAFNGPVANPQVLGR